MARKISLTVDERVILHLLEFVPYEEDFESPEGSTQAGIASAIGIQRKHIPRAMKKLLSSELVSEKVSHVKNSKQRKKVYFLTFEGRNLARKIWDSLAKKEISIQQEDGKRSHTTFADLCFTYQVDRSPIQLLLMLREGNVFYPHMKDLEEEEASDVEEGGPVVKDMYKKILTKAWEDEILTKDEDAILNELRSSLGISKEEHLLIQEEILDEKKVFEDGMDKKIIYQRLYEVAMKDGTVTGDEQAMLDELSVILGLDGQDVNESINSPVSSEGLSKAEVNKLALRDVYTVVLREALRDGHISQDEQNIIIMLKKFLSITEKEHLEIYDSLVSEGK